MSTPAAEAVAAPLPVATDQAVAEPPTAATSSAPPARRSARIVAASSPTADQARLQAEELVRRGYRVTVVCPREPGTESGTLNGVEVRRLPVRWRGKLRRPSHVALLFGYLVRNLHRFDLVHIHLAGLQTETVTPLAMLHRKPVYVKMAAGGTGGDQRGIQPAGQCDEDAPAWRNQARADAVQAELPDELIHSGI